MILIFILGLYCFFVERVRITRRFALTGNRARGATASHHRLNRYIHLP